MTLRPNIFLMRLWAHRWLSARPRWFHLGVSAVVLSVGMRQPVIGAGAFPAIKSSAAESPSGVRGTQLAHPTLVVELYTSESCPECPPAEDSLVAISRAATRANVTLIPLSFHVAYWNQDGWVDPFSDTLYTIRQRSYDGDRLYTPQGVVNGTTTELTTALLKSPALLARAVTVEPGPGGFGHAVTVHVSASQASESGSSASTGPARDSLYVYLVLTDDSIKTHVTAGENRGRSFTHVGVVRYIHRIGKIGAAAATLAAIPVPTIPSQSGTGRHLTVLAQAKENGRLGAIVGATTVSL